MKSIYLFIKIEIKICSAPHLDQFSNSLLELAKENQGNEADKQNKANKQIVRTMVWINMNIKISQQCTVYEDNPQRRRDESATLCQRHVISHQDIIYMLR